MPNAGGLLFGPECGIVTAAMAVPSGVGKTYKWMHATVIATAATFTVSETRFALRMLVDFGIVEYREDNGGEFRLRDVDEAFVRARAVRELTPSEMRRALLLLNTN